MYMYTPSFFASSVAASLSTRPALAAWRLRETMNVQRELRGSQGMGVVGNSWFDRALLSIAYMFRPSC